MLFLACATAYAFFQVPYVAMPAEMTDDYDERTRLMTWRVAILALAILVSGGLSPLIRDALGPEWGYRGVGLFVGALILVGTVGAWWGTRDTAMSPAGDGRRQPARAAAGVRRLPHFRTLLAVFVLQALATGSMLAGRRLRGAGAPRRRGRRDRAVRLLRRAGPRRDPAVAARGRGPRQAQRATSGVGAPRDGCGRDAVHGPDGARRGRAERRRRRRRVRRVPDVPARDAPRRRGGRHRGDRRDRAGTYTGVWTAGETLGLALGPFLYAAVLTVGGYVSSTDAAAAQPDSALTAIAWGFTVLPAALVAISLVVLRRYRLDEEVAR